jgi:hypothetical protein
MYTFCDSSSELVIGDMHHQLVGRRRTVDPEEEGIRAGSVSSVFFHPQRMIIRDEEEGKRIRSAARVSPASDDPWQGGVPGE